MIQTPLKLFIEKKFGNLHPIDIQCILTEEERKCQKHHILGIDIWYLASCFIWESDMSLTAFFFYLFIDLMQTNAYI